MWERSYTGEWRSVGGEVVALVLRKYTIGTIGTIGIIGTIGWSSLEEGDKSSILMIICAIYLNYALIVFAHGNFAP